MKQGHYDPVKPQYRSTTPCRCKAADPDDAELRALFHDLSLTLFEMMDPADADLLARTDLQGQTPAQIAAQIGCSPAEATRRINDAQRCFFRLVALSFASAKSE